MVDDMSMILANQIVDLFSVLSLLTASFLFFYILLKYYKGMKTPPFWIYVFAGFLFITFVNILGSTPFKVNELVLRSIRLIGHLLFLMGIIKLLKTYSARIKFDKK